MIPRIGIFATAAWCLKMIANCIKVRYTVQRLEAHRKNYAIAKTYAGIAASNAKQIQRIQRPSDQRPLPLRECEYSRPLLLLRTVGCERWHWNTLERDG